MAETDSYIWKSLFPESPRRRPCHRSKQAACRHGGQIYMYGGRDGNRTLQDFWRYDVVTNIWTRMECGGDAPPPLHEHTMVAQRGCLFIFGGELGYGSCGETPLWIYSIARQTWEKPVIESEVMTPTGRRGHTAVAWRGGMHVYGGYVDLKGSSNELWTLDFETRWWHLSVDAQGENSPSPRHWHSAVVYESNMWVYGGLNNLQPLRDLWRWNFESRQWTRIRGRQSPGFLHGHSAVRMADSMMVFGGEDSEGEYRNELWKFHFASSSWHTATPNRRITPTSCTRHVMLSIPSNHIVDDSYLLPPQDGLRPQSAPTQAHHERIQEGGGAGTPTRLLMDLFTVRPHSSPPVIAGNERRNADRPVHRFVNRIHPSPDDDTKRTLFDSDEDGEGDTEEVIEHEQLITVATEEDARINTWGEGMENGKWAVPMTTGIPRDRIQKDIEGMELRHWAVTSTVPPEDVEQVEEKESSKLIVNEESPVHGRRDDGRWAYQDEMKSSCLRQKDGEWILEEVLSEPSSPVSVIRVPAKAGFIPSAMSEPGVDASTASTFQELETENCIEPDPVCNNLVELPKSISVLNSIPNVRLNNGCNFHHAEHVFSGLSDAHSDKNFDDTMRDLSVGVAELPSIQEPEEQGVVPERSINRGDVIHVRPLDGRSFENDNIVITDRHELLPSNEKSVATFVNLGFMSSHEDLHHPQLSQGMDFRFHQLEPSRTIMNGSVGQSDVPVPNDQSGATLYPDKGQVSDALHQSQPPALVVNGAVDQSATSYQPHAHLSQSLLHQRKRQLAQVQHRAPHQRVIHVKPTNQRVCQITVEEMNGPSIQSNTVIHHRQQNQRPSEYRGSSTNDSRPRLHGRSQTLNNLPDRNRTVLQRPQTLQLAELTSGQNRNLLLCDEQKEDKWTWPIFLYLMGGEETGSCSLHRNNSPMSVWKCCIVQGKPSDSEVQHILSQY
ncbi:uncharacterized protein LOC119719803 [Patiria miniata]|uniref:Uncharacterized protein n=1 Tax=Patiria miniata TaxID=46514 RepID=A0A913Z2J8_PATMI|nr:uncharacterized protein LOC119719803 [Patiria miniata]